MLHVTCSELPGDPTMHTGRAHTRFTPSSRVCSGDASTQDRNIRLCLWTGRPAILRAGTVRPHTSPSRRYVNMYIRLISDVG